MGGMLASFKAWFFLETGYVGIVALVSSFAIYILKPSLFIIKQNSIFLFLLLAFSLFLGHLKSGLGEASFAFFSIIPIFFILILKPFYQDDFLNTIRRFFSVLLLLSLICWFAYYIGFSTPYSILEYGAGKNGGSQYYYENHYAFLINISRLEVLFIPRFSSVFLEPGYLGCLLAMLLYIGRYKIDVPNVIFFISLITTFSLAGYILFFGGFIVNSLNSISKQKVIVFVIIFSLICIGLFQVIRSYNNGHNLVNELIIARVEYDEGIGRSGDDTKQWFWNKFVSSDSLWFGGDEKNLSPDDVDMTAYVVQNGFVSLLFFVCFIMYPGFRSRKKLSCIPLSIIYLLIFAQTIHLIQSYMYLIVFVLGINRLNREHNTASISSHSISSCVESINKH